MNKLTFCVGLTVLAISFGNPSQNAPEFVDSVATNNGWSDWATTAIPAEVKTMWYRFSRREELEKELK